ncbi:helix-turn-helix domain-containing protein [Aquimarina sp. D1M17]|uniref:helix-turn-helix domain-containing protein n=1 Tax=Aquimarina acroporae TaxID=2937283 RepID=UPI0020BE3B3D|nr:helix-turn-helix transcriptional regulator [Aquimarina acroporae]MCK8520240.1 helix-turn-helix domain-containing protein [Aquimarina acroporae]
MDIHERVKEIIEELNLSNNSFAAKIGVTSTTIDSITAGRLQPDGSRKRTKPGYDVLKNIIDIFEINPYYLFEMSQQMFRNKELENIDLSALTTDLDLIKKRLAKLESKSVGDPVPYRSSETDL